MKKSTILLPLLAAVLYATADEPAIALSGAELGAWTQDYAAATNAAATDGKPVFLDFTGSDWCGWCMLMERQVFSQREWKDWAATNLYLVTLDFPHDKSKVPEDFQKRNRELSKEYGVRGYPTYIVLDAQGKKLGQLGASRNAKPGKFIRQLCKVLGIAPPAKANAVPADPAAKRLVEDFAAALKSMEKQSRENTNPTVEQAVALAEKSADEFAAISTDGVPENLLPPFRNILETYGAMTAEFKKLDQTKTFRELGRPSESHQKAMRAFGQAIEKFVEAAEACGVEDAADVLEF